MTEKIIQNNENLESNIYDVRNHSSETNLQNIYKNIVISIFVDSGWLKPLQPLDGSNVNQWSRAVSRRHSSLAQGPSTDL